MNKPLIETLAMALIEALNGDKQEDTSATVTAGISPLKADLHQPFEIGANYFFRLATYHVTGRVIEVGPQEIILEDAAWIASSGRFMEAIKSADFNEVEPFPEGGKVIIGRSALIDATQIPTLPRSQK